MMTHRYLCPTWWVDRLAGAAGRFVSPRYTIAALVWSAARAGEPELLRLEQWVPRDRLALDIGANCGIYTWRLARLARQVHAFEPQAILAKRLKRAVPNAVVHACALSDRVGMTELRMPVADGTAYYGWGTIEPANRLAAVRHDAVRKVNVPLRRLDDLDFDDVGFVKLDVEGHELAVLRGAENTLRRCGPTILLEADDRHRPQAIATVRAFLGEIDYSVSPACSSGMWLARPSSPSPATSWRRPKPCQ